MMKVYPIHFGNLIEGNVVIMVPQLQTSLKKDLNEHLKDLIS